MSALPASPGTIPHCAAHPEVPARTICERCGGFCCASCVSRIAGRSYCAACAVLPGVNYLETIRLRFWGRRDTWAWFLGGWGVLLSCLAVSLFSVGDWRVGTLVLGQALVSLGCFLRQRWARWSLLGSPLVVGAWLASTEGILASAPALLQLALGAAIFADTRNQLFFQLPVGERALHRLWDRYENNPLARSALVCGLFGMMLPPMAIPAVLLGAVAWRRVDPEAHPPIGHGTRALGAMALGLISLVVWTVVLVPRWFEWLRALT